MRYPRRKLFHIKLLLCKIKKLVTYFNDNFPDIMKSLDIKLWPTTEEDEYITDEVTKAVYKYKYHPSILKIKERFPNQDSNLKFRHVLPDEVNEHIVEIKTLKSAIGNVPLKNIKLTTKCNIKVLCICINVNINNNIFSEELKFADITPAFKKAKMYLK